MEDFVREVKKGNEYRMRFKCPVCDQQVRSKNGRFECKHHGTPKQKSMLHDADKFELDEVNVQFLNPTEG